MDADVDWVAVGNRSHKLTILNSETGVVLHSHEFDNALNGFSCSPDGKYLAVSHLTLCSNTNYYLHVFLARPLVLCLQYDDNCWNVLTDWMRRRPRPRA